MSGSTAPRRRAGGGGIRRLWAALLAAAGGGGGIVAFSAAIGPGPAFASCPGYTLNLSPASQQHLPGGSATVKATLRCGSVPVAGQVIAFSVSAGPDTGAKKNVSTSGTGAALFGLNNGAHGQGIDVVQARTTTTNPIVNATPVNVIWATATLLVSGTTGVPGQKFAFTGKGFAANENVGLHWGSPGGLLLTTVRAGSTGLISGAFVVPDPPGANALVAVGAMSAKEGWAPFSQPCTDEWVTTSGGDFATASSWSTGAVPGSGDVACVTMPGTANYTVTVTSSQTVGAIMVGSPSGSTTQSLLVQATGSGDVHLTLAGNPGATSMVQRQGVLALDSTSASNDSFLDGASGVTVQNKGVLTTVQDGGGARHIRANVTNMTGATVTIGAADTRQDAGTTTTNDGSFTVSSGNVFSVAGSSANSFAQMAGTLAINGVMTVNGATFIQSGGTGSGSAVTLNGGDTLLDTAGPGAFLVQCSTTTLKGGIIPVGQTVTVQATICGVPDLVLATDTTNNGTLTLDSVNGNGAFVLGSGTLTNNGTLSTVQDGGGTRYIRTNVTNASGGVVSIGAADTRQDAGTTTTNNGSFTVLAGGAFSLISNGNNIFTQAGGTLSNSGTVTVSSANFVESGGTGSGNPVTLTGGDTLVENAGTVSLLIQCGTTTMSGGSIATGQTVTVQATSCGDAHLDVTANAANGGAIVLDSTVAGNNAFLEGGSSVLLTNNGSLSTLQDGGGSRLVRVGITNSSTGTMSIAAASTSQDANTTTTNNGSFSVSDGVNYNLASGSTYSQGAGGTLNTVVDVGAGVGYGLAGSGSISVGGTLGVTTNGSPTTGTLYTVVSGGSLSGTFATLNSGVAYTVGYSATTVTLTAP